MPGNKDRDNREKSGGLMLAGGGEFGGQMQIPDRRALDLAGKATARVSIIPAAAAPDDNHRQAGKRGELWFRKLGVVQVGVLPLIDRATADRTDVVEGIERATLTYLLGGFPAHLERSLAGSLSWQALLGAYRSGAVIAGSSAGAMVLCGYYYNPSLRKICNGLGLLPGTCFLPHHNRYGQDWVAPCSSLMPAVVLVGVDEETAILNDGAREIWTVYGGGVPTIYRPPGPQIYRSGESFRLPLPITQTTSRNF